MCPYTTDVHIGTSWPEKKQSSAIASKSFTPATSPAVTAGPALITDKKGDGAHVSGLIGLRYGRHLIPSRYTRSETCCASERQCRVACMHVGTARSVCSGPACASIFDVVRGEECARYLAGALPKVASLAWLTIGILTRVGQGSDAPALLNQLGHIACSGVVMVPGSICK